MIRNITALLIILFFHELFSIKKKIANLLIPVAFLLNIFVIFSSFFFDFSKRKPLAGFYFQYFFAFLICAYLIFIIYRQKENIAPEGVRKLLLIFLILVAFFFPILVVSDFRWCCEFNNLVLKKIIFFPFSSIFFITWEIMLLSYVLKWTTISLFL